MDVRASRSRSRRTARCGAPGSSAARDEPARQRCRRRALFRRPVVPTARPAPAGADDRAGSARWRVPRARLTGIGTAGLVALASKDAARGALRASARDRQRHRRARAPDDRWLRTGRRPDGSMTYIRRGAIVQFPRTGRAEVLRSREQLARRARACSSAEGEYGLACGRVAWLGPGRFAIVASAGPRTILAVFSGRSIVAIRTHAPIRLRSYARARRETTSCCVHRAGCGCTPCAAARCRASFASARRPRSRGPATSGGSRWRDPIV